MPVPTEAAMSHKPDKKFALSKDQSPIDRETVIRRAIQDGVPLNQIESWLDWLDQVEQSKAKLDTGKRDIAPKTQPPNPLPETG